MLRQAKFRSDGIAFGSSDLAFVNGRLDPSGRIQADFDRRSRDRGREDWRSSSSRTPSGSLLPVLDAPRTSHLLGIWSSHSFLSSTSA
jgi:hypothetical protein